jgi:hypothetical protein
VEQKPFGYQEDLYSSCADNIRNRMQNFDISIAKITSTVLGCPNLVRVGAVENSKGFICSLDKKKVTVDGVDYCCEYILTRYWCLCENLMITVRYMD